MLGPLHVKLHLTASPDGTLSGTVDSPDQGMVGVPCTDVRANGQTLSFSVPMVRGSWTGFLSGDGNALSGMWSQGTPMALNLSRVTANGASGAMPGASAAPLAARPATAAMTSPPGDPASGPPCPATAMFNYFDGSAWKPMMQAVALPRERGMSLKGGFKDIAHNPLNPSAGQTNIYRYKEASAPLTLGQKPRFCVTVPPNYNPSQILIGEVEVKKDHREIEQLRSANAWLPQKDVRAVDAKRIAPTVVEVTPQQPLAPGQYIIGGYPTVGIYDFGVQASN